MRKLLSLILILVLCAAMVPAALAEGDVIEITVFHYKVEGDKAEGMEKIQELFKQAHPEVTIEFENLAYSQGTDFWPQLETAIAAGDNPEIIMGNPGLYVNLIEEGYIMDLTGNEVIQELGLSAGDMGDVSYQGKWYAYPVDFKSWGVFYNTKIFEELGLEVPSTKSELLAICEKLQENGITPWANWYADGASVDIEMRPVLWTKALANGDKDMFEKLMSGRRRSPTIRTLPRPLRSGVSAWETGPRPTRPPTSRPTPTKCSSPVRRACSIRAPGTSAASKV